jgi:hypothetical protein
MAATPWPDQIMAEYIRFNATKSCRKSEYPEGLHFAR